MEQELVDKICYHVDKGTWRSTLLTDMSGLFMSQEEAEKAIQTLVQTQVLTEGSEGKWLVVSAWSPNEAEKMRKDRVT